MLILGDNNNTDEAKLMQQSMTVRNSRSASSHKLQQLAATYGQTGLP